MVAIDFPDSYLCSSILGPTWWRKARAASTQTSTLLRGNPSRKEEPLQNLSLRLNLPTASQSRNQSQESQASREQSRNLRREVWKVFPSRNQKSGSVRNPSQSGGTQDSVWCQQRNRRLKEVTLSLNPSLKVLERWELRGEVRFLNQRQCRETQATKSTLSPHKCFLLFTMYFCAVGA